MDWIKVFLAEDGFMFVDPSEGPRLDAALSRFLEYPERHDGVIHLLAASGAQFSMPISRIVGWVSSSAATRRREMEIEQAMDEESETVRRELGIWESE